RARGVVTVSCAIFAPCAGIIRIRFHGRSCRSLSARFGGLPCGHLHRIATGTLASMPNLSAHQVRAKLAEARLYLCTDARAGLGDLAEFAEAVLSGGVDILQLRYKTSGAPLEARQELAAHEVLADACREHGALLAVN